MRGRGSCRPSSPSSSCRPWPRALANRAPTPRSCISRHLRRRGGGTDQIGPAPCQGLVVKCPKGVEVLMSERNDEKLQIARIERELSPGVGRRVFLGTAAAAT